MNQKKSSQEQGKFTLDVEETILLRGKVTIMKRAFIAISNLAHRILQGEDFLSLRNKESIEKIKDIADNNKGGLDE